MATAKTAEIVPVSKENSTELLLSAIAQAAADPQVNADKMRALWELKREMDAHNAKLAFMSAMRAAQNEMRPIVKDAEVKGSGGNVQSKYARLETIDKAIRPVYSAHGFTLSFNSRFSEEKGELTVLCECMHAGGHSQLYELSGGLDLAGDKGAPNKTPIKAVGSSNSYLKRYLTANIFNVVLTNDDNDGNGAEQFIGDEQRNQILDLILACKERDPNVEASFLRFMGVKDVEHVPARQFALAMNMLQAKHRKLGA